MFVSLEGTWCSSPDRVCPNTKLFIECKLRRNTNSASLVNPVDQQAPVEKAVRLFGIDLLTVPVSLAAAEQGMPRCKRARDLVKSPPPKEAFKKQCIELTLA